MGTLQPSRLLGGAAGSSLLAAAPLLFFFLFLCAGCHRVEPVDTKTLDSAGMNYDSIKRLSAMNITQAETAEMVEARRAGLSDDACIQILQIYRSRQKEFDSGHAVGGLIRAGASENLVMSLAQLDQLGLNAGELQAMRLAGLSDNILLAVARRRAAGEPVLSGASLAGLKNLGLRSDTLLALAQRGVPDSQAAAIMSMRKHGARDAEILRRYAGS